MSTTIARKQELVQSGKQHIRHISDAIQNVQKAAQDVVQSSKRLAAQQEKLQAQLAGKHISAPQQQMVADLSVQLNLAANQVNQVRMAAAQQVQRVEPIDVKMAELQQKASSTQLRRQQLEADNEKAIERARQASRNAQRTIAPSQ